MIPKPRRGDTRVSHRNRSIKVTPNTPTLPTYSEDVNAIIRLALAEDIGRGDITTEATIPLGTYADAVILQKAPGVLCGLPVVEAVFAMLDKTIHFERLADEGSWG